MKLVLVAVKDEAGKCFMEIQEHVSTEVAIRNFKAFCKNQVVKDNPEDFNLYQIGTYDRETGKITGEKPTKIALAMEYIINIPKEEQCLKKPMKN